MNIFILCTGRSASSTFMKACKHIENYTTAHESLSRTFGKVRLDYPKNHIEIDNRLVWYLDSLERKYDKDVRYVHLQRDKEATAKSFNQRWNLRNSIVRFYCEGILMTPLELIPKNKRLEICREYVDFITDKIDHFLLDKTNTISIRVEDIKEEFVQFWNSIGAKGDLDAALHEFDLHYNKTEKRNLKDLKYNLKLTFLRLFR